MQAVLILAHNQVDQLLQLVRLLKKNFSVYIHVDVKCKLKGMQKKSLVEETGGHLYQQFDVHWGGFSIVNAEMLLIKEALKDPQNAYFHVISGLDWPAMNVQSIYDFYENTDQIYMSWGKARGVIKSREPIILWQKYYFDYDHMNRRSLYGKIYHRLSLLLQSLRRVNKFKDLSITCSLYQGSNWCDLPRYAAKYIVEQMDEETALRQMFQTGFCSDEFFYQTILCNSMYQDKIINNNHRYIHWTKKHGSYPGILDGEDIAAVKAGDYHFMRKIDLNISNELIHALKTE